VNYYDGFNVKLYEALPKTAARILELGCAHGKLGGLFVPATCRIAKLKAQILRQSSRSMSAARRQLVRPS